MTDFAHFAPFLCEFVEVGVRKSTTLPAKYAKDYEIISE